MHECIQDERIDSIETVVEVMKNSSDSQAGSLIRIEDKIDKIIYFILGSLATLCIALIGFIIA